MNETYRILIADDEPLVQIGLKSMLDRDFPSFEVVGTASNGREALKLIGDLSPDVVISDIKMPIMTGPELIEKSHEIHGPRPVFIMLTAYEDFNMARSAFSNEACDYLVKIELSPDALGKALDHAARKLGELPGDKNAVPDIRMGAKESGDVSDEEFRQIFAIKLLNNVFTDKEALMTQAAINRMDLDHDRFIAVYGELMFEGNVSESRMLTLYSSTAAMTKDILSKYAPAYMVTNDRQHFTFIFYFSAGDAVADEMELIQDGLDNAIDMINSYFSVKLRFGIGTAVSDPTELHVSFEEARTAIEQTDENTPVRFFSHIVGANRRSGKDKLIASIRQYVDENLDGKLQLGEVAETFGLSSAYLSTIFKKSTDVGFSEYVYTKKIEKAKEMLLKDDMKIYEVADALSFESSYYFSKVFKKVEGVSPREWINSKL
ncbi:MAG: response regulator [Lachnospiraceae bacterium]|nr:response regulator [Lachnospiraceae bacterium]MBQ8948109.1 response regulator [Lachnospiraceae bacterium]